MMLTGTMSAAGEGHKPVGRCAVFLLCLLAPLSLSATASARTLYATNQTDGTVSVISTDTNQAVAPPIAVGAMPSDVAITPDGRRAYVTNAGSASVSVIDTQTHSVVGSIAVGGDPRGIAISPDGRRAYVTSTASDSLYAIDTQTNSLPAPPIPLGVDPEGVAVSLDGRAALIAQNGGGIAAVDTATGALIGTIPNALGPARLAITPNGTRGFVTNGDSSSVTVFSLTTGGIHGVPILVGSNPSGVAITIAGLAYAASESTNTVQAIDAATHVRIGPPTPGFEGPLGVAATPDGRFVYVANGAGASLSILDTTANVVVGQVGVGNSPAGVAIVPDQAPSASFTASPAKKRAGQPIAFDASPSTDADGQIVAYEWNFGDGESETTSVPTIEHTYNNSETYQVTLRVIDNEGCSTDLLFTGQTASCNGSPAARTSQSIALLDTTPPLFRLRALRRVPLAPKVKVTMLCPKEGCTARARGTLLAKTPKQARKGKAGSRQRPAAKFRTAPVKRRLAASLPTAVSLRLPKAAIRAARASLRAEGRAILRISAVARDKAGNKARRTRVVRLVLPGKGKK